MFWLRLHICQSNIVAARRRLSGFWLRISQPSRKLGISQEISPTRRVATNFLFCERGYGGRELASFYRDPFPLVFVSLTVHFGHSALMKYGVQSMRLSKPESV